MRNVIVWSGIVSAIAVTGCAVTVPGDRFDCTTAEDCPSGWVCREGLCSEDGPGHDAGMDADLQHDAGPFEDAEVLVDAFTPPDALAEPPDASPGPDGGTPLRSVRVAQLIPDSPGLHVCLGTTLLTRDPATGDPRPRHFRDVSRHTAVPIPPGPLAAAVYDSASLPTGSCPSDTTGAIFMQEIDGATFTDGRHYTVAATGLLTGGTGEPRPELIVFEDDRSAPATPGNLRLRFVNAVPNMPAAAARVDLCYDSNVGDSLPGVVLIGDITFEEVSEYLERAPISFGALSVHAHPVDGPVCNSQLARTLVPLPLAPDAPSSHVTALPANGVRTIFIAGDGMIVTPGTSCTLNEDCASSGPPGVFCGDGGICTHALVPSLFAIDDTATTVP